MSEQETDRHARTRACTHTLQSWQMPPFSFFISPPLSLAFFVRCGEIHFSPANLNSEKRITGLANCHTFPGKRGKVIWFEINPFTVNIWKQRGKRRGKKTTRHLDLGIFQAGVVCDSSTSWRWRGYSLSWGSSGGRPRSDAQQVTSSRLDFGRGGSEATIRSQSLGSRCVLGFRIVVRG